MTSGRVVSVNIGAPRPNKAGRQGVSGIDRRPVEQVQVRAPGPKRGGLGSGVVGDFIGATRHHGGDFQAVYLVADTELSHWGGQIGRPLVPGSFGENLTVSGIDIDVAVVGTRLAVGTEVVLRVTGPRIPCATFAAHMGERAWVRRFAERGRTGAYCAVERPGTIRAGDHLEVLDVPDHGVDLVMTFRALMGDRELARQVVDAHVLNEVEHGKLARTLR